MREPLGSRRQYLVEEDFAPTAGAPERVLLRGPVQLLRTDAGILAAATLETTAAGECARCLREVAFPMRLEVEEEFLPTVDPLTGAHLPPPDDPNVFTIDPRHILDLTDAARQAWVLALPMQTLCSENCRGLCPECGADRNNGPCACTQAPRDSRWAALAAFRPYTPDRQEEN